MTKAKAILLTGLLIMLVAGTAVAVKLIFFPSVSDKYFQVSASRLRKAPPNVVVVRPTHFASTAARSSPPNQIGSTTVKGAQWMVGVNVTFQQLIATAYGDSPAHIALPADAPRKNFDYLVTVPTDPNSHLQSAIRRKLGYVAQRETRDTAVMALTVKDPNSPGLKISSSREKDGLDERNGRLYFTHQRLSTITGGLEQAVTMPVVDKTGLTNFYDFSLVWDKQTQQGIQNGTLDAETGGKILAEWGLALEPDTASMEMLVVKKEK